MKCLSFIKNHIGTFTLFCLLFVSFFVFSLFVSNSVSAVSDYSVTINKDSVTLPYYLCGNSSGFNCSDYSYISVSFGSVSPGSFIRLYLEKIGSWYRTYDFYTNFSFTIVDISSLDSNSQISILPISSYSGDVTYTFMTDYASIPSGSITLTQNGTYDVTSYSEAVVDVSAEVVYGDYHQDLINITNGIYVCAGTILVIYFFYCIFQLII